MNINERFRQLRVDGLKMTMREFSEVLGVTPSGISDIENGRRNVTNQHIRILTSTPVAGKIVSEEWLREGTGEMFIRRDRNEIVAEFVGKALADKPESARNWAISMLAEFSDDWWDEVNEVLKKIRNKEIGPYADDEKRG